jgi:hypothetical protein
MTDDEIDARASEIAATALDDLLWLLPQALRAIRDGDAAMTPADRRRTIRRALAAIDAAAIPIGLEMRP